MSRCCICGRKYNKKDIQGLDIVSCKTSKIYHVTSISGTNHKLYKLCQNCIKAVAFGASIESELFEIIGFKPKYYKDEADDE